MALQDQVHPEESQPQRKSSAASLFIVPLGAAIVTALVVGVGYGLVRLGEWREPVRSPVIAPANQGVITLDAASAALTSSTASAIEHQGIKDTSYLQVNDVGGIATWRFFPTPGDYDVVIEYACADDAQGGEYAIKRGDQVLKAKTQTTGGWDNWRVFPVGRLHIEVNRARMLTFEAISRAGDRVMNVRGITLTPATQPASPTPTPTPESEPKPEPEPQVLPKAPPQDQPEAQPETQVEVQPVPAAPGVDVEAEPKPEQEVEQETEPQPEKDLLPPAPSAP